MCKTCESAWDTYERWLEANADVLADLDEVQRVECYPLTGAELKSKADAIRDAQ